MTAITSPVVRTAINKADNPYSEPEFFRPQMWEYFADQYNMGANKQDAVAGGLALYFSMLFDASLVRYTTDLFFDHFDHLDWST